jgi:uncharacterized protein (DUF433 family)
MGLYGNTPADEVPAYSKAEVALYLQLPKNTVSAWTRGTTYTDRDGAKVPFYPVIVPASPSSLSFQNLVELFVLKSLRRDHDVPLPSIRTAIAALRERSGSEHPLAEYEILTDRRDLILEEFGKLYNLNRHGQLEMGELLEATLRRVGVENGDWTYRPVESVVLSPARQFGRPCIVGTRIPTDLVFSRHTNGETVDEISWDLECDPTLIGAAIDYERELRAA